MAALPLAGYVKQLPSLHHVAVPAQPSAELEEALSLGLPEERLRSIRRQRHAGDRLGRLLASVLLEAAAAAHGVPFDPGTVSYPAKGAPQWRGGPRVSVSHCAEHVVVLLGPSAVGVDIESPGAARLENLERLGAAGLSERVRLGLMDPTQAWMWVEAAVKTGSEGLAAAADLVWESDEIARFRGNTLFLRSVQCSERLNCWCAMAEPWTQASPSVFAYSVTDLVELLATRADRRIGAEGSS